ncbi:hypothetical protein DPMN_190256 [Dreissena polymorpha]|uniref:Secreted protein n=1 Tax=Dreissena polymorpha TaxID=45954 RepID=A0A9D4IBT0_DREPO|nr:hypothetical protein DPMN_190256 [Dreissena polymorpha]
MTPVALICITLPLLPDVIAYEIAHAATALKRPSPGTIFSATLFVTEPVIVAEPWPFVNVNGASVQPVTDAPARNNNTERERNNTFKLKKNLNMVIVHGAHEIIV